MDYNIRLDYVSTMTSLVDNGIKRRDKIKYANKIHGVQVISKSVW